MRRDPERPCEVRIEADVYVYEEVPPNNDTPMLFPSDGTGMYGDNNPYGGQVLSQSAGFSSNLDEFDGGSGVWLQQQFLLRTPRF